MAEGQRVKANGITVPVHIYVTMNGDQATAWAQLADMEAKPGDGDQVRAQAMVRELQANTLEAVQERFDRYATVERKQR